MTDAAPTTLLGLMSHVPDERIAIIEPEHNVRLSYGALKQQVQAVAESLVAAGVGRSDRVGIALPNGVPNIVSFLAASGRHQCSRAASAARRHR